MTPGGLESGISIAYPIDGETQGGNDCSAIVLFRLAVNATPVAMATVLGCIKSIQIWLFRNFQTIPYDH